MRTKLITRNIRSIDIREKAYDLRDTVLRGFLLRVQPSGRFTYYCDYRRPNGQRTRLKIGDANLLSPSKARDEALKILGSLAAGLDPTELKNPPRQETLKSFILKYYLPWVSAHRKTGIETVNRTLKEFTKFSDSSLEAITPWEVEKWRANRLNLGLSPATANRYLTMLKAILAKAVEWGFITKNSLGTIKALKTDQAAKARFLDALEEKALRKALDEREACLRKDRRSYNEWCGARGYPQLPALDSVFFADHLKPMVLVSINTGLRRGELFKLCWKDLDFERRLLTVCGESAKNGRTRHIPLNKEAMGTLKQWHLQRNCDSDLVFVGRSGNRFNNIKSSWSSLLQAAGISPFRWHDLRHHFASMLVINGVDLNMVRELLGHSDMKMTLRYAHLSPLAKAEAVAKLDSMRILSPESSCKPEANRQFDTSFC